MSPTGAWKVLWIIQILTWCRNETGSPPRESESQNVDPLNVFPSFLIVGVFVRHVGLLFLSVFVFRPVVLTTDQIQMQTDRLLSCHFDNKLLKIDS